MRTPRDTKPALIQLSKIEKSDASLTLLAVYPSLSRFFSSSSVPIFLSSLIVVTQSCGLEANGTDEIDPPKCPLSSWLALAIAPYAI